MALGTLLTLGLIGAAAGGGALAGKKIVSGKMKALDAAAQQGAGGGGGPDPASVPTLDIGALGQSAQQAAVRRKKIAAGGDFFRPSLGLAQRLRGSVREPLEPGRGTVSLVQGATQKPAGPLTATAPPAQAVPRIGSRKGLVATEVPAVLRGRVQTLGRTY